MKQEINTYTTRNQGLDYLKFICSFLVICIHIQFPTPLGSIITPLTRIAVPIFFMITGYFYSHTQETNSQIRQIKKIAKLFVLANVLYAPFFLFQNVMAGQPVSVFIEKTLNTKTLLKFVFFNESPFSGHLWYLGAVFYVLLILYFTEQFISREKLYPLIPLLLFTDLALGKYSLALFGREFPYILVRNFLFVGLPYVLLGDMLYKAKPTAKSSTCILLTVLFIFTTLGERFVLTNLSLNATRDHYLSTTLLSVVIFLSALNHRDAAHSRLYKNCCMIGSKLSTSIYILHPIWIDFLLRAVNRWIGNDSVREILAYGYPFFIFLISAISAWLLHIASKRLKNHLHTT